MRTACWHPKRHFFSFQYRFSIRSYSAWPKLLLITVGEWNCVGWTITTCPSYHFRRSDIMSLHLLYLNCNVFWGKIVKYFPVASIWKFPSLRFILTRSYKMHFKLLWKEVGWKDRDPCLFPFVQEKKKPQQVSAQFLRSIPLHNSHYTCLPIIKYIIYC